MSFSHGKDATFSIDDSGGTLRLVKADISGVTGLPGARGLSEVTAFGDQGTKSIPGLANVQFSISGHADWAASIGIALVLQGLRTTTATSSFEYGPAGTTTGNAKYTGECWMTDFTIDTSVSDRVPVAASFQVDGLVTAGTY